MRSATAPRGHLSGEATTATTAAAVVEQARKKSGRLRCNAGVKWTVLLWSQSGPLIASCQVSYEVQFRRFMRGWRVFRFEMTAIEQDYDNNIIVMFIQM